MIAPFRTCSVRGARSSPAQHELRDSAVERRNRQQSRTPLAARIRLVLPAAVGSATVDGVMAPGEWDASRTYPTSCRRTSSASTPSCGCAERIRQ